VVVEAAALAGEDAAERSTSRTPIVSVPGSPRSRTVLPTSV
jgi:hypothetical protein